MIDKTQDNLVENKKWQEIKLGDVAEEIREIYSPVPDEHLKYIGLEHIEQNTLKLVGIGDSSKTKSSKKVFKKGDILFGSLRPYFRKVVKPKFDGVCSTDITVIRSRENCCQGFLFYFIANQSFIDYATNISYGTRMPRSPWDILSKSEWMFPNLNVQQKIASILSAYDDLIENNTRRIQILEQMAQMIYREWFIDFRFPGYEKVKFVNSELGKIPEGWEIERLSDIVETQYGYTESASDEIIGPKFLRGKDINKNSYINWDEVPYCKIEPDNYERYKLNRGDIVIIRMADPGKVGIVEKDIDAIFASYLIRLKIKNGIDPYYLFYFLLSEQYQSYIVGASTGTTRKSASAGVITDTNILLPNKSILEQFVEVIKPPRQLLNTLLEKNVNLRKTRDLLLPKLISGELDVSELDIVLEGINEQR